MSSTHSTYSKGAIAFHWIIAALIIGMLVIGNMFESLGEMGKDELRSQLRDLHKPTGILILVLSVGRLIWRLTHKPPALPDHMKGWEKLLSKVTHVLFYVLIIAIPLSGWMWSSSGGSTISMYGLFDWPLIPGLEGLRDLKDTAGFSMRNVHGLLSDMLLYLLVLHILAALKHHFFDKDNVLARMAPVFKRKDQA